jgi:hypothetical protein
MTLVKAAEHFSRDKQSIIWKYHINKNELVWESGMCRREERFTQAFGGKR